MPDDRAIPEQPLLVLDTSIHLIMLRLKVVHRWQLITSKSPLCHSMPSGRSTLSSQGVPVNFVESIHFINTKSNKNHETLYHCHWITSCHIKIALQGKSCLQHFNMGNGNLICNSEEKHALKHGYNNTTV